MPTSPPSSWYVIRLHRGQEFRAAHNLEMGGIEVFLPRTSVRRRSRAQWSSEIAPLFPQYLFARFDPDARLHDVMFTRGVQAPVRVGTGLATLDEAAVEVLRSRVHADGLIHVGEPLQPGQKIVVDEGPFTALIGIVERCMSARERVIVLLSTIHAPLRLELATHAVRRLPQSTA